jgi:hypothetical protein
MTTTFGLSWAFPEPVIYPPLSLLALVQLEVQLEAGLEDVEAPAGQGPVEGGRSRS